MERLWEVRLLVAKQAEDAERAAREKRLLLERFDAVENGEQLCSALEQQLLEAGDVMAQNARRAREAVQKTFAELRSTLAQKEMALIEELDEQRERRTASLEQEKHQCKQMTNKVAVMAEYVQQVAEGGSSKDVEQHLENLMGEVQTMQVFVETRLDFHTQIDVVEVKEAVEQLTLDRHKPNAAAAAAAVVRDWSIYDTPEQWSFPGTPAEGGDSALMKSPSQSDAQSDSAPNAEDVQLNQDEAFTKEKLSTAAVQDTEDWPQRKRTQLGNPSAPTTIGLQPSGTGSVDAAWPAVPSATSYLLELSAEGSGKFSAAYFGPKVQTKVEGLKQGVKYIIRVRAENVIGASEWTIYEGYAA